METTIDQRVQALFDQLATKKEVVAKAEKPVYVTGGQFRFSEDVSRSIDITTVRDERKLVEILTFLKERSSKYAEASADLGCEVKFTWLGFTVEEWTADLKTRVNILQISKRKAELVELEARLNAIVSPELRRQMELAALEKALTL